MDGNPYADLIHTIEMGTSGNSSGPFRIGTVYQEDPLKISINNLEYQGADLIMTDYVPSLGDKVLIVPYDDDQRMIVLSKVVGL